MDVIAYTYVHVKEIAGFISSWKIRLEMYYTIDVIKSIGQVDCMSVQSLLAISLCGGKILF